MFSKLVLNIEQFVNVMSVNKACSRACDGLPWRLEADGSRNGNIKAIYSATRLQRRLNKYRFLKMYIFYFNCQ